MSNLVIMDDIETPPLTPEQQAKLRLWFEEMKHDPKLEFHFTVLPSGDTITSIRLRHG